MVGLRPDCERGTQGLLACVARPPTRQLEIARISAMIFQTVWIGTFDYTSEHRSAVYCVSSGRRGLFGRALYVPRGSLRRNP